MIENADGGATSTRATHGPSDRGGVEARASGSTASRRPEPCKCATCRLSRGMTSAQDAIEQWLNEDFERQINHAWLRDEAAAVALSRRVPVQERIRLREALRITA